MPIDETEAIAVVRRFVASSGRESFRGDTVKVRRVDVEGEACWAVDTDPALRPGEPDWFFEFDGGCTYLVSVSTGQCIGLSGQPGPAFLPIVESNRLT